jgi:hypothetical protein
MPRDWSTALQVKDKPANHSLVQRFCQLALRRAIRLRFCAVWSNIGGRSDKRSRRSPGRSPPGAQERGDLARMHGPNDPGSRDYVANEFYDSEHRPPRGSLSGVEYAPLEQ